MAHALPPSPGRRRNRLIGTVLVVVVIVALVAAGFVIRDRRDHSSADSSATSSTLAITPTATTPSATTPATTTAATTPTPTTAAITTATKTAPPTIKAKTSPSGTPSPPSTPKVALIVANNTGQDGLASTAEARFVAKGWKVTDVTNVTGGILSTCAFYDPRSSVNRIAAEALRKQFPAIKRVEPRFSRLPTGPIVVVLTTGYH